MSQPGYAPRDLQMAELTRGAEIPQPALQSRHLRIIAEFLVRAWQEILATHDQAIHTQEEKEINTLMEARLLSFLQEDGEWRKLVRLVCRGRESCNHNGVSLEKRPDLSIFLTKRDARYPLIIECKLIDKTTPKGVTLYGTQGMTRFLDGEYAWYAWEAFMLAYVRDGSTISNCLTPHLVSRQKRVPDPFLTEQLPQTVKLPSQDLARSRHSRRFPKNPGSIAIWHLWVS